MPRVAAMLHLKEIDCLMVIQSPIIVRTPCFPWVLRKLHFFSVLFSKNGDFHEKCSQKFFFRINYILLKATKNQFSNNYLYQHILKVTFSQKTEISKIIVKYQCLSLEILQSHLETNSTQCAVPTTQYSNTFDPKVDNF